MIGPVESFSDALTKLQKFLVDHGSALPDATRNHLLASANHPSPVDRIVQSAEALYAVKSALNADGRAITAQLAQFAAINGFHGMTDRGQQIALAMNRIGGFLAPTGITWPHADDDPLPLERFVPPSADDMSVATQAG